MLKAVMVIILFASDGTYIVTDGYDTQLEEQYTAKCKVRFGPASQLQTAVTMKSTSDNSVDHTRVSCWEPK